MNIEGVSSNVLYVPETSYDKMSSWRREHMRRTKSNET